MKNISKSVLIAFIFSLTVFFSSCTKEEFTVKDGTTIKEDFYSDIMNDAYQVDIYFPPSFDPDNSYPVVYLMDGNVLFNQTAGIIDELIIYNQIPSTVLIGVGHNEDLSELSYGEQRTRDYTYPSDKGYDDFFDIETGKANLFYQALTEEIIPKYELEYSINPESRTLAGHSLSGFFTCYVLFDHYNNSTQFENYLCASPSLWYGDAYIFKSLQEIIDNSITLDAQIYMTVGDLEGVTMNTHFEAMESKLNEHSIEGLSFEMLRLDNTNHSFTPLKTFEGGFKYLLNKQ